jgi:hypothetical protein
MCCQSILIASKCDPLDRAMLILSPTRTIPIVVYGNACFISVQMGQKGTKYHLFDSYCRGCNSFRLWVNSSKVIMLELVD